jgi:hypothetical protein
MNARAGSTTSAIAKNGVPTRVAVATRPSATSPRETDVRNIAALPVDSEIVAERAD